MRNYRRRTQEIPRRYLFVQILLCTSWKWNRHSSYIRVFISSNHPDREKTYCYGTIYRSSDTLCRQLG
ncbi:hypothetical protein NY2A_B108L [Paramecium bursaria Chlorella virus NY2A]|uniref:Uncharacterized protein B108L n=2 Tax=Chlorovirus TaxID=181083 RepID=A7IVY3_PBCVN|nr:hypothetical protein NY2A_B108L [Paramecium bursaria Chlorella virus NY2A]ABT14507.1 hypothetical protein NY2A_B108L [Paramecium bursaria Chlorella virus NY2A]